MEALHATEIILWVIAGVTVLFEVILGMILSYHLRHFALNKRMGRVAMTLYVLIASVLLLFLIGLSPAHFS